MLEYRTSVHYLHSPHPWDNETMGKNIPSIFNGWFTLDELRDMNTAFANKDPEWTPNFSSGCPYEVSLHHPYNKYYVLIHGSRTRG